MSRAAWLAGLLLDRARTTVLRPERLPRRINRDYVEFLEGIGASEDLIGFARDQVARDEHAQAEAARRAIARGQALVEFALVMPVLFMVIFAFILLATFSFNKSVIDQAAGTGARAGNDAMFAINSRITDTTKPNISMLLTPYPYSTRTTAYGPYPAGSSNAACLKTRNRSLGNPYATTYPSKIGWDWGSRGCGVISDNLLRAPLDAAVRRAQDGVTGLLIGPRGGISVSACYANSVGTCLMTVAGVGGGITYAGVTSTTAAPSFIKVDVAVTAIRLADIPLVDAAVPPSVTFRSSSLVVIDRFLPACPAPTGSGTPAAGSCGAIY